MDKRVTYVSAAILLRSRRRVVVSESKRLRRRRGTYSHLSPEASCRSSDGYPTDTPGAAGRSFGVSIRTLAPYGDDDFNQLFVACVTSHLIDALPYLLGSRLARTAFDLDILFVPPIGYGL